MPAPVRSCRNLGWRGSRQRPESGAGPAGWDHGPEAVDRYGVRWHGWRAYRCPYRWPGDDLRSSCADLLAPSPGAAAGDLLRRRDRRTRRAVDGHLRQLGGQDRFAAGRGARRSSAGGSLRVDLPTHWLGPVFLGAAWTVGLVVVRARRSRCRGLRAGHPRAVAVACRPAVPAPCVPSGSRFVDPLPGGRARLRRRGVVTARRIRAVGPAWPRRSRDRRIDPTGDCSPTDGAYDTRLPPADDRKPGVAGRLSTFTEPLVVGGSTVWVRNADPNSPAATRTTTSAPLPPISRPGRSRRAPRPGRCGHRTPSPSQATPTGRRWTSGER